MNGLAVNIKSFDLLRKTTGKHSSTMVGRVGKIKLEDLDFLNKDNVMMRDPVKVEFMLNVSIKLMLMTEFNLNFVIDPDCCYGSTPYFDVVTTDLGSRNFNFTHFSHKIKFLESKSDNRAEV